MKRRRAIGVVVTAIILLIALAGAFPSLIEDTDTQHPVARNSAPSVNAESALATLDTLEVKGRAPKTGYDRDQFGGGWATVMGCSTRDIILNRDLQEVVLEDVCTVTSGVLQDPYTGEVISFSKSNSSAVQVDHVVALSDAWQKGAQLLSKERRIQLANDPLELLAVDGPANQQKGDGDAATWLPSNKPFRCEYVERQVAVKKKYLLWVTEPEKRAMQSVLSSC